MVGLRTMVILPEVTSFLILFALSLFGIALFTGFYALFLILVAVDGLATLAENDSVITLDRSMLFLALVILSIAKDNEGLPVLFLEILVLIAALDTSFLLRRVRGTECEGAVILNRFRAYARTLVPSFLLSFSLSYMYSFVPTLSSSEGVVLLGVSCTSTLAIIYVLVRYLSPPAVETR